MTGVRLRPGQKLSITYRAGTAPSRPRAWTFTASESTAGTAALAALAASPAVTVTAIPAPGPPWLIIFLTVGLAVGLAVTLAVLHYLRNRKPPPPPCVEVKPDPGPPGQVTVQNTGTDRTVTVQIQPDPGDAVINVERTST